MTEYDHYVVIDLEATCCDDGSIRRKDSEIIEIGAVRVDSRTFETLDEFQTFVRPVVHPTLTRFCTELTTITQAQVDGAPRFAEAIEGLSPWFAHGRALFCSWGDYDKNQFEIDARRSKVKLPFGGAHLNVKRAFSALGSTSSSARRSRRASRPRASRRSGRGRGRRRFARTTSPRTDSPTTGSS